MAGVSGSYPPPIGAVPMLGPLGPAEFPDRPDRCPANPAAEVLYSDQSWRPAMVLAWRPLRGGWAVRLRWPDRTADWRRYDARYLRPDRGEFAPPPQSPPGTRRGSPPMTTDQSRRLGRLGDGD
jgi:hypothetical protein